MRTRGRDDGRVFPGLLILVAIGILGFAIWTLPQAMNARFKAAQNVGVATPAVAEAAFSEAWSVRVTPPLIHEMAATPDTSGQFLALNKDEIYRFDPTGKRLASFAAPSRSIRIATDPNATLPYIVVVSSAAKSTGAIDYTVTTDYYLQALDGNGGVIWKKRFDPKDVSSPEPIVTTLRSHPAVVLSTGRRILCFDAKGDDLWDLSLWHHPGTVTPADLQGGGGLLAALAPRREIVGITADGARLGPWGTGEGPSRFRAIRTSSGMAAISLRQVFGRGPGVRQVLAFFDASGKIVREVELPPDASQLTYSPIAAMDIDGSGRRKWVVGLGDGTILVYSAAGEELARHATGSRMQTMLALPQRNGTDLLITATPRGLTAWRPVSDKIQRRR
jgi:hypothetical protein